MIELHICIEVISNTIHVRWVPNIVLAFYNNFGRVCLSHPCYIIALLTNIETSYAGNRVYCNLPITLLFVNQFE